MTDLKAKLNELKENLESALNAYGEACRETDRLEALVMTIDAEIKECETEILNQPTESTPVQATFENFHKVLSDEAYSFYRYTLKIDLVNKYDYINASGFSDSDDARFTKCMGELVKVGLIKNGKFTKTGLAIKSHLNS
jgi:hypothetical protein